MEAPAEAQEYLEQGQALLWQGQVSEAAAAFARAVELDPALPAGHLGLAQANLALGAYGLVQVACQRVQEIAPGGSAEESLASALLFVLDHRYDSALEATEQTLAVDPSQGYAHALRGYCLRRLGRDYEAALAEARAARLGGNTDFRLLFPAASPAPQTKENQTTPAETLQPTPVELAWRPHTPMRRRMIRLRFATRAYPLVTLSLIALNVAAFLLLSAFPDLYLQSVGIGLLILQGEFWRVLTAIFFNFGWLDLLINMLWLYIIGRWVEQMYGPGRFLLLYLGTGLIGGLLTLLVAQNLAVIGAASAVLGIFGALGAYIWHKGPAAGLTLGNWIFWLMLNLALTFGFATFWLPTEMGGLAAGLLLGLVLLPDFWKPIRVRFKRGQKAQAIGDALRLILPTLAIDAGLMLLAALISHSAFG